MDIVLRHYGSSTGHLSQARPAPGTSTLTQGCDNGGVICSSCGGASSNTARFCGTCGNPLQRICGACGSEVDSSHQFCSACGVELDDLDDGAHHPHPTERKLVTVLFADIVDSTSLVEGLDPEEANDVLLPLTEAMRQAVTRYGGIVTAVEGDGIMALFGAPVADEHHADRRLFRLARYSSSGEVRQCGYRRADRRPLGEVLVHAEGDEMSYNYVATGPTVHLASRMEASARPGIPLVTEATASLAAGNVRTGPAGTIDVRGFEGPIEVYELMGKADATGSWQSRMTRKLTSFVARTDELDRMRDLVGRPR